MTRRIAQNRLQTATTLILPPNPTSQTTEHGGKRGAYNEAHRQKDLGLFCTPDFLWPVLDVHIRQRETRWRR
jgi:hypothetical protein